MHVCDEVRTCLPNLSANGSLDQLQSLQRVCLVVWVWVTLGRSSEQALNIPHLAPPQSWTLSFLGTWDEDSVGSVASGSVFLHWPNRGYFL